MKILTFLFVILMSFSSMPDRLVGAQKEREKIKWDEQQKLTWADFKGAPEVIGDYVASTNSGISFSYGYKIRNGETKVTYSVTSNFYPYLSWFQPGKVSSYILQHEQTHFDISEVHARMLRKRLSEVVFSTNVKEEIENIYLEVEENRRRMQSDFDEETDHSKRPAYEAQWESFVANQLKKYDAWK